MDSGIQEKGKIRGDMLEKKITYEGTRPLVYCISGEEGEPYLIHNYDGAVEFPSVNQCFVLPLYGQEGYRSYQISSERAIQIGISENEMEVTILTEEGTSALWKEFEGAPCCDIMGNAMELDFRNGEIFQKTYYHFYWETLLPSIVERTRAKTYPVSDGYVVSTLQKGAYAGTYPDVDHEFQIKGRLAMADELDLAVVKRMMELQFKLMEEDPEAAYRDPCAIQPDGTREYHVRRNSMDNSENAEMFLVTGNIEIIESAWFYYAAVRDKKWLMKSIGRLEKSLSLVESCIDRKGRLWSDVYYEDQVIKDGRECMAQALAARSFEIMAQLEAVLEREDQADYYNTVALNLKNALTKELPEGFWDHSEKRFIDWVDRNSGQHDHIHLLANELPVLFHYATPQQAEGVKSLMMECFEEFQRFPSFVSAKIADYTAAEIGSGGPYDLCAAGRYWCWDFAYWKDQGRNDILEQQLLAVCTQAELDQYRMGERYDMNYVYYLSDRNWHGAAHYYEYPCVFIWNLIAGYTGVRFSLEADLEIEPMLCGDGRVRLENPRYGIEYELRENTISVHNLLGTERTLLIKWKKERHLVALGRNGAWSRTYRCRGQ